MEAISAEEFFRLRSIQFAIGKGKDLSCPDMRVAARVQKGQQHDFSR